VADKPKKLQTYCIQAKLSLIVSTEVSAHDLDEALAKSKEMNEDNFVEILGEYMDGNHTITGVYLSDLDV